ncbi:unnamed protein product [Leptosia nina]|uniref:Uncharacterized protein n=1 Tax=Leptosia nina TaxID=320188 RepID=A0AAV1JSY9_9NEOP
MEGNLEIAPRDAPLMVASGESPLEAMIRPFVTMTGSAYVQETKACITIARVGVGVAELITGLRMRRFNW